MDDDLNQRYNAALDLLPPLTRELNEKLIAPGRDAAIVDGTWTDAYRADRLPVPDQS